MARYQWLTPVILTTQEAEIRGITVWSQPRQKIQETLSQKYSTQKRAGRVLRCGQQAWAPKFKLQYCQKEEKKALSVWICPGWASLLRLHRINTPTYTCSIPPSPNRIKWWDWIKGGPVPWACLSSSSKNCTPDDLEIPTLDRYPMGRHFSIHRKTYTGMF
jgi:hypothetical protein